MQPLEINHSPFSGHWQPSPRRFSASNSGLRARILKALIALCKKLRDILTFVRFLKDRRNGLSIRGSSIGGTRTLIMEVRSRRWWIWLDVVGKKFEVAAEKQG